MKRKDTIEITVTLRGNPAGVVNALANGLPLEALVDIRDGLDDEMAMRRERPARGRRRQVRIVGRARK